MARTSFVGGARARILRQRVDTVRVDAAGPEGVHPGLSVRPRIVRHQITIGGDDRAQILAELHVDGRAVVDGADAHGEELADEPAGLLGEEAAQLRRHLAGRQDAAAAGGEPEVARRLALKHRHERVENGGLQHGAEIVLLAIRVVEPRRLGVGVDRGAERRVFPDALAELLGEVRKHGGVLELTARAADRGLDDLGIAEVLEDRDEIREALVEGQ